MNKFPWAVLLCICIGCSDGDLEIETLDFDSVAVQQCGSVTTATRIFFKINQSEALILNLENGLLKNEATTETITSAIPGKSKLTYRVFNETLKADSYFCADIPPVNPKVIEEIVADGGQVLITTTATADNTFEHTIQLAGINLTNGKGERITDLSINDFGTVTTKN